MRWPPERIVHAVYSGHRYARELDADPASIAYRRDAPLQRRARGRHAEHAAGAENLA